MPRRERGKALYNEALDGSSGAPLTRRERIAKKRAARRRKRDADIDDDIDPEIAALVTSGRNQIEGSKQIIKAAKIEGRKTGKLMKKIEMEGIMEWTEAFGIELKALRDHIEVQIRARDASMKAMDKARKAVAKALKDKKIADTINSSVSMAGGAAMFIPGGQAVGAAVGGATMVFSFAADIAAAALQDHILKELTSAMTLDKIMAEKIERSMLYIDYYNGILTQFYELGFDAAMVCAALSAMPEHSDYYDREQLTGTILGAFGVPGYTEGGPGTDALDAFEKMGVTFNPNCEAWMAFQAADYVHQTKEAAQNAKEGAKALKKCGKKIHKMHKTVKGMFKPKTMRTGKALWKTTRSSAFQKVGTRAGSASCLVTTKARLPKGGKLKMPKLNKGGAKKLAMGVAKKGASKIFAGVGIAMDAAFIVSLWASGDSETAVQTYLREMEKDIKEQRKEFVELKKEMQDMLGEYRYATGED